MISNAAFSLTSTISRMVRSKGTEEDIRNFEEDLEKYVRQKQRTIATRMLERIYDNDWRALRNDIESAELAKILVAVNEKTSISEPDRKKLLGLLYPVLDKEYGIKL